MVTRRRGLTGPANIEDAESADEQFAGGVRDAATRGMQREPKRATYLVRGMKRLPMNSLPEGHMERSQTEPQVANEHFVRRARYVAGRRDVVPLLNTSPQEKRDAVKRT